mmetsp:Transcript_1477/g.5801  ORF Transcript_1477/g.5801 Transcript_1477/m.5801 type:complete len:247 (-) Transcript_1477:574-1314(-)
MNCHDDLVILVVEHLPYLREPHNGAFVVRPDAHESPGAHKPWVALGGVEAQDAVWFDCDRPRVVLRRTRRVRPACATLRAPAAISTTEASSASFCAGATRPGRVGESSIRQGRYRRVASVTAPFRISPLGVAIGVALGVAVGVALGVAVGVALGVALGLDSDLILAHALGLVLRPGASVGRGDVPRHCGCCGCGLFGLARLRAACSFRGRCHAFHVLSAGVGRSCAVVLLFGLGRRRRYNDDVTVG